MFLSDREERKLEGWLIQQLQEIRQKNPEVLAQYIISLLKQDQDDGADDDALKSYCTEEVKAFLKDKSSSFIDLVFRVLAGKFS